MVDGLDGLINDVDTDTTNVLLTLVRIWFTLSTGEIAPKDLAAEWGIARVSGPDRQVIEKARAAYLGEGSGDWRGLESRARTLAQGLVAAIRAG
jgi:streptomycin 3"-adenylyltransferase